MRQHEPDAPPTRARPPIPSTAPLDPRAALLAIQRGAGNRATRRLLRSKLTGAPPAVPRWLRGIENPVHVRGRIWEIHVKNLGRVYVGPYGSLGRFLATEGLSSGPHLFQAAHIANAEHLADIGSPYSYNSAPAVAMPKEQHAVWTSNTTKLQKHYFAGRSSRGAGRTVMTSKDAVWLHKELYSDMPQLQKIADDVLNEAKPGTSGGPKGGAPEGGKLPGPLPRTGKIAGTALRTVGGMVLQGIAIQAADRAFFGPWQEKLDDMNRTLMQQSWRDVVWKKVKGRVEALLNHAAEHPEDRGRGRVYLNAPWTLVMHEWSDEWRAGAWWMRNWFRGAPGFAEAVDHVECDMPVSMMHVGRKPPAEKIRTLPQARSHRGPYRVYGVYVTSILVSDPEVWSALDRMRTASHDTEAKCAEAFEAIERIEGGSGSPWDALGLFAALRERRYAAAATMARELEDRLSGQHGGSSDYAEGLLRELAVDCDYWAGALGEHYGALDEEQRGLFAAFEPGFPPRPAPRLLVAPPGG